MWLAWWGHRAAMSAPRAAAQLLRMPVSLGYSFRPATTRAGTAQRAIPTIAPNNYQPRWLPLQPEATAKHILGESPTRGSGSLAPPILKQALNQRPRFGVGSSPFYPVSLWRISRDSLFQLNLFRGILMESPFSRVNTRLEGLARNR